MAREQLLAAGLTPRMIQRAVQAGRLRPLTAAALWRLRLAELFPIEVTLGGDRGRKLRNLIVHRARLDPREVMRLDGMRVTTPARTIVDLAAKLSGRALRELTALHWRPARFTYEDVAFEPDIVGTDLKALLPA